MVRVEGMTMPRKCATTLPCFKRAGGPSLGAWRHPMLMVDTDSVVVEARLLTGELACPSCGGVLRPWGHARWRPSRRNTDTVRHRPRRASCTGCAKTHVLLSTAWLSRRGDAVSVIGAALLAKAAGQGHRPIATALGRPVCTVRGGPGRCGRLPQARAPPAVGVRVLGYERFAARAAGKNQNSYGRSVGPGGQHELTLGGRGWARQAPTLTRFLQVE